MAQGRHLAAAVGAELHLVREQCGQPSGGAAGDGRMEGVEQLFLTLARRGLAHLALGQAGTGAGHQLAAGGFLYADGLGHSGVVQVEDLDEQVGRAFLWREPFQQQEEGGGQRGGEFQHLFRRLRGFAVDGFRQPGADVVHPRPVRQAQLVDAVAGAEGGQPGTRVVQGGVIAFAPLEEGLLHRILGVAARAEDAVGQVQQEAAAVFEDGRCGGFFHLSASISGCGSRG
ncbi:hypothetical protein D3C72_1356550 [compost metagenome]